MGYRFWVLEFLKIDNWDYMNEINELQLIRMWVPFGIF